MNRSTTILRVSMAGKAKALSDTQVKAVLAYLREHTRYPERNEALFLPSCKAGLRARELQLGAHVDTARRL